jgi:predicted RNase H-like HicB family nuclease
LIREVTAIIQREGEHYVAFCPEFDVASQGGSVELARANLAEAVQLFQEIASSEEILRRMHAETYVTRVEVAVG